MKVYVIVRVDWYLREEDNRGEITIMENVVKAFYNLDDALSCIRSVKGQRNIPYRIDYQNMDEYLDNGGSYAGFCLGYKEINIY